MFGDEWPQLRTFPNGTVRDGERLTFGAVALRVIDLGPGESPHDSLADRSNRAALAFVGDLVYSRMQGFSPTASTRRGSQTSHARVVRFRLRRRSIRDMASLVRRVSSSTGRRPTSVRFLMSSVQLSVSTR